MSYCIALVHVGSELPPYLIHTIEQARLFNACPIFLIAHQEALDANPNLKVERVSCESLKLSDNHQRFNSTSTLDKESRNGFWHYTTERIFYLEAFARENPHLAIFHLENDVLLYRSLKEIHPILQHAAIAGTLDNDIRCVPGFIYFSGAQCLEHLTHFMTDIVASGSLPEVNDMILIATYWRSFGAPAFTPLPVVPSDYPLPFESRVGHHPKDPSVFSNGYEQFRSIFDAAALGQYLGGVDPHNSQNKSTTGFVNESAVYSADAFQFSWKAPDGILLRPFAELNDTSIPINNLHIHSKNLEPFRSDRPKPPLL